MYASMAFLALSPSPTAAGVAWAAPASPIAAAAAFFCSTYLITAAEALSDHVAARASHKRGGADANTQWFAIHIII
jgi:hypothetical protein